jgi:hypothetical protein
MENEKPVDVGNDQGFPPSEEPPSGGPISSATPTTVSDGPIGSATSTCSKLSDAVPNLGEE